MFGSRQKTLAHPISCNGIGLHSGNQVQMTLHPAEANTGILFKRTDVGGDDGMIIPARFDLVGDTRLCTQLDVDGITVGTVEHLAAALWGCGIDNVIVELDAAEVPVMDGSSAPYIFLIQCAGVVVQEAPRQFIRILKPIRVGDDERYVMLEPHDGFAASFHLDYQNATVDGDVAVDELTTAVFRSDFARARTFGFAYEVEYLRSLGLAKGGSLENAVVIEGDKVLNKDGLRFADECVRHKVLDAIGDLFLVGHRILGKFTGVRSGHATNNELLHALMADRSAWQYEEFTPKGTVVEEAAVNQVAVA